MMHFMARHQGRALADPRRADLPGNPNALFEELERHLQLQHPDLTNISVSWAGATGDWDTNVMPVRRWFDVRYTTDA
jgi:hypothetical protein